MAQPDFVVPVRKPIGEHCAAACGLFVRADRQALNALH
jgi:hypothetical protein